MKLTFSKRRGPEETNSIVYQHRILFAPVPPETKMPWWLKPWKQRQKKGD